MPRRRDVASNATTARSSTSTQTPASADDGRLARRWTEEDLVQYVQELIKQAPPLTVAQRAKIASLLRAREERAEAA